MPNSDTSRPNYTLRVVALLLIAFAAIILLLIVRMRQTADQQQLHELVEFVLETGTPTIVPAEPHIYFFRPADNRQFYELRAISQSGGTKAIQVRQRRDGMLDVFLLDLKPADLMSRMKPAGVGSYYVSDNS